jgi:hypothetical protein
VTVELYREGGSTTDLPKTRRTPTQKQIEHLDVLAVDDLVPIALIALHALNRRAKKLRDQRGDLRSYGRFAAKRAAIETAQAMAA